jgi:hypothetical protein
MNQLTPVGYIDGVVINIDHYLDGPNGLPAFLALNFATDARLKGKIAEGGGGVVYRAELLNKEAINRFGTSAAVVKVLKRKYR